jgi:hypothetical protein
MTQNPDASTDPDVLSDLDVPSDPDTTAGPGAAAAKDPEDWVTGDEPATASQLSYLRTLAQDSSTDVPEQLTKAEASKLIDELQAKSPRVSE